MLITRFVLRRHNSQTPCTSAFDAATRPNVRRCQTAIQVSKCIYTRLGWPSRKGGMKYAFIQREQADTQVLAFCKISENRHTFARLR